MAIDQPEVALNKAVASGGKGPKPGLVSARAARSILHGVVCLAGVGLGADSSFVDERPLGRSAADVGGPLVMNVGDSEVARELNLGGILNSGV